MNMVKINLSIFTNILAMCKNLHWVTNSYAKHMALDQAFDEFKEAFDKYVEVALGILGRDAAYATDIINNLPSDEQMVAYVSDEFVKLNNELYRLAKQVEQLNSGIDEIKSIENQLIYRLTLI